MAHVKEHSVNQDRWNSYGIERIRQIEREPERYRIDGCPIAHAAVHRELLASMAPVRGKRVLELGCGRGDFSVWLAQQGADVIGVDIGSELISACEVLARVNGANCSFRQGNIVELPFETGVFDCVVGLNILHHLSAEDLRTALRECHRVLKPEGKALFYEPVENSRWFDLLQKVIPAGRPGKRHYRPSIFNRKAWAEHVAAADHRNLTNRELAEAGRGLFDVAKISPYGFLIRLARIIGNRHRGRLYAIDGFLFRWLPPLRRLSQTVLVEYRK